ncbi:MAG: carboxypeptidase regulatory-like domain-containing protein [Blastocatellia bacterium]
MPLKVFATLSLLLSLSLVTWAQSSDAALTGAVTDQTGAVVPSVKVSAANTATGVTANAGTNEAGIYLFPSLPPGVYRVTVEHTGFQKMIRNNVLLEVGGKLTLDLTLTVGNASETIEVNASPADTQLGYQTSSVGNVVTGRKLLELPLQGRNALEFASLQAGVNGDNISGTRAGATNITLDGVYTQDSFFNGSGAANLANTITTDRIQEFRVVTSPADVELGRGSGQIIMVSRSGTNAFHGSLFEEHRNTALNANDYFNNLRGNARERLIRNQYGGRLGGPLHLPKKFFGPLAYDGRNRTFFHFHYEGQRQVAQNTVTSVVYTETARRGLFRFYPGAQNANAIAARPAVDLNGNPVRPTTATGDLQAVSVFGRDPLRPGADPTGNVARTLGFMPLPNNFRAGDGLNTAGYTWNRPATLNFDQWDLRLDHNFNQNHRIAFTYSQQGYDRLNSTGTQPYPGITPGSSPSRTKLAGLTLTSVLRANLINEVRLGANRPRTDVFAPFDIDPGFMGRTASDQRYLLVFSQITSPFAFDNYGSEAQFRLSPIYSFGDTATWLKDKHAFKFGAELRLISTLAHDKYAATPRVITGSPAAAPVTGIETIPGIGVNLTGGRNLLADLSGNVSVMFQTLNAPGGTQPYLLGLTRYRHWGQNEFSWFAKDDWKVRQGLTLNLGVRWDYISVPQELDGKGLDLTGGGNAIFGISGRDFGALFRPGVTPNQIAGWEQIGPGTPNPDKKLWGNDWNNFAPGVGLSWSLPWLGKDKTVVRLGYGMAYERNPLFFVNSMVFGVSGYASTNTINLAQRLNLADISLPLPAAAAPLAPVPLTYRTNEVYGFDPKLRTPYYQNFNVGIQRQLTKDTVFEARYVGNVGRKLPRILNINEVNIFENGILEGFRIVQAGGQSPLFNQMFAGLPGVTATNTGSDLLRSASLGTQTFFANNNPGGLAGFLNNTQLFTGVPGGLLRRIGLPENWIVANPQFNTAYYGSNFGSSNYHSLQLEAIRRFSAGWTIQGNYTLSKALGDNEGNEVSFRGFSRTLRDRSLDRRTLSFNRRHVLRVNGIWELPFGKGRFIGKNAGGFLNRLIGGWQVGGIYRHTSGTPVNLTGVNAFNQQNAPGAGDTGPGIGTPVLVGNLPKDFGAVTRVANGVTYFQGLQLVNDPWRNNITAAIRNLSTMTAVADASGNIILRNGAPGEFGNLQQNFLTGPGFFQLDMNLLKRIKIKEGWNLILRADAINVSNTPVFANPNASINSLNFGNITSTANPSRVIVVNARIEF